MKKFLIFLFLLPVTLSACAPFPLFQPAVIDATRLYGALLEVVFALASLAGVAALVAVLVNVLKAFKVVTDGNALQWTAGLNLVAMAVLIALRIFKPDLSLGDLDAGALMLSQALTIILGYVIQLISGRIAYRAIRGIAFIGYSHSLAKERAAV